MTFAILAMFNLEIILVFFFVKYKKNYLEDTEFVIRYLHFKEQI